MPTESQLSANRANAQHSTGPRTAPGQAVSSQNALTHGLFTARDFIRPGEEDEYNELSAGYRSDLSPGTALEQTYVAAMIGAAWRLRRCSLVEANMVDYIPDDPMENGFGQKIQTSVDRARSQAFNILRRSTQELRRLQTDRALRTHIPTGASASEGLASPQQFVSTLAHATRAKLLIFQPALPELGSFCKNPAPDPEPPVRTRADSPECAFEEGPESAAA